jgi:YesN/AraC family two-component response regulator
MTPISVLVVDDEPVVARVLRRALSGPDLEVIAANCADEALDVLRARPVDVLMSDIDMPGLSGLDLVARVRSEFPCTLRMLLSGSATLERALEAINDGEVTRFFAKPFEGSRMRENLLGLRGRIERARTDRETRVREHRANALRDRIEARFPGTATIGRDDAGRMIVDPTAIEILR